MKRFAIAFAIFACYLAAFAQDLPKRPKINALGLVRFRVSDLQKSRDFYQQTFQIGNVSKDCFEVNTFWLNVNVAQRIDIVSAETSSPNYVQHLASRTLVSGGL